jgi:prepilin signal peptidase PulO-like enzyme (type II secretory pathway)
MIVVLLTLLGLIFGSFVNALVWRLKTKRDWVKARSVCVHCKHVLEARDLIPVLSWLWLKGKCRYCRKPIHWQYPLVEILMAGLFVVSYVLWPVALDSTLARFDLAVWLVCLVGFVALAVYDIRWLLLPNRIVYPLLILAIARVVVLAVIFDQGPGAIRGAVLGLLVGGGLFYIIFQVSQGKWIGGGDVKLGFLLGLLLGGPLEAALLLFVASVLGTLTSVPLLITGHAKRGTRVPFGPFLLTGAIVVKLVGPAIVGWYSRQFLFL